MREKYHRNESCVVGLPSCDYVFNSGRSSFIAYGFEESRLEMEILRGILKERNIEVFEAGGGLEPGKNAFCTKICSKIITSQFCVVLLNQDTHNKIKMPNANVNMEYGLMLGFNKYIIPFQRQKDKLPFNVSGLDTIKYTQSNFKEMAEKALDRAIEQTKPKHAETLPVDRIAQLFILSRDVFLSSIDDVGSKNIYDLGSPFGYFLLNDYSGINYYYLGVFNNLSIDQTKWRINKLEQVISARFSPEALEQKVRLGAIGEKDVFLSLELLKLLSAWIVVQTEVEKTAISDYIKETKIPFEIFSIEDIYKRLEEDGQL